MDSVPVHNVAEDVKDIHYTIIVGFMGFTILVYDHIITFADEFKYVWQKPKGLLLYLFLLNRYLIPLGFSINLFAYLWPDWTDEVVLYAPTSSASPDIMDRCAHFVRYEGSMTVIGINVVGLIMLLRIRAIYNKNPIIVGIVATILLVEFSVNVWLVANGIPVRHTGPVYACSMIFSPTLKSISSSSAWLPLLYDTVVLLLTFYRTMETRRAKKDRDFRSRILAVMFHEGLMYYSVIFTITLILTIMINVAPPNLQNITAQLELLLTVAMTSRITLDLRKEAHGVAFKIGSNQDTHALNTGHSNHSTVIFRHTTQDLNRSLDLVTVEFPPDKPIMDWNRELQSMESRVEGQTSPTRPRPTRWFTANTYGASTSKGHSRRGKGLSGSASLSRLDTEYNRKEAAREWIELGLGNPPPRISSSH